MTPWHGWAQVVHVGGVSWAGPAGDKGTSVLCLFHGAVSLLLHHKQEQGMAIADRFSVGNQTAAALQVPYILKPSLKLKLQ